jgi:nucleoid-associated protein YgaU
MSDTGQFTKLIIKAFDDPEKKTARAAPYDSFEAYYNPTTFQSSYALKYDDKSPEGQSKREMKYGGYEPASFSFELLLDGTGASLPSGNKDTTSTVEKRIAQFMAVAYGFSGDTHRGSYLEISWGAMHVDKCVLASVNITYDLFSKSGSPLRAKLACSFKEYSFEELIKAEEQKKSPDVTHIRVVQQGDRLPNMCERIYGDAKLYLQVARANNLLDYRNLTPGSKLFFPPLAKN